MSCAYVRAADQWRVNELIMRFWGHSGLPFAHHHSGVWTTFLTSVSTCVKYDYVKYFQSLHWLGRLAAEKQIQTPGQKCSDLSLTAAVKVSSHWRSVKRVSLWRGAGQWLTSCGRWRRDLKLRSGQCGHQSVSAHFSVLQQRISTTQVMPRQFISSVALFQPDIP